MKLTDIIALTKAGYTKKDVDRLIALEIPEPTPQPEPEPEPIPEPEPENGQNGVPDVLPAGAPVPDNDPIKDELEKLRKETEDLKAKLAAAQNANIHKNNDKGIDEKAERDKRIADYMRNLM